METYTSPYTDTTTQAQALGELAFAAAVTGDYFSDQVGPEQTPFGD